MTRILRFAQDDKRRAQDDKRRAQDDKRRAQNDSPWPAKGFFGILLGPDRSSVQEPPTSRKRGLRYLLLTTPSPVRRLTDVLSSGERGRPAAHRSPTLQSSGDGALWPTGKG